MKYSTRGRDRITSSGPPGRKVVYLSPRERRRPSWRRVLFLAGIFFCLWEGAILGAGLLLVRPVAAVYGTLTLTVKVEAVIFRRERLIPAPAGGVFLPHHPPGERIPREGTIGRLRTKEGEIRITAPAAGLLSYRYDGLEGWTMGRVTATPAEAYRAARKSRWRSSSRQEVRRGDILARLVDDERQYLFLPFSASPLPAVGQRLVFRGADLAVVVEVWKVIRRGEETWLILATKSFPPAWLDRRQLAGELVLRQIDGVLVPERYLCRQGEETGVLVSYRGKKIFRPVEVLATDRQQAVVRGISPGTVLLPPAKGPFFRW